MGESQKDIFLGLPTFLTPATAPGHVLKAIQSRKKSNKRKKGKKNKEVNEQWEGGGEEGMEDRRCAGSLRSPFGRLSKLQRHCIVPHKRVHPNAQFGHPGSRKKRKKRKARKTRKKKS